ncbi:hypothetical protein HHK36_004691 [Tetracentron sinense]|uniref:Uncharacterized protein n=1 Tax=Tetracentron sinense TaxID=13715 RepID=A0A835DLS6_TETSI|nr:hypothetical protein HHK36_004691 [Tetracentron sinense]
MGIGSSNCEDSKPIEEFGRQLSLSSDSEIMTPKESEPKLPHNYEAILKDADPPMIWSSMDDLKDQLHFGVFLNQKRKASPNPIQDKYWVEKNSGYNCFMLFARDLSITWAEDEQYWHWHDPTEITSADVFVDVAEVLNVCWLEVHGKFNMKNLSQGIKYEVVFVVMLKNLAYGWEVPVNLRLALPDGNKQERKERLLDMPRGEWVELRVGEFHTSHDRVGKMQFTMFEYEGGKWKRGLVIKGASIRPKK